jgi:hypothetical protein
MKYLKTFEYKYNITGTLGKIYPGRFKNLLMKHCQMLDNRGIEYDIYVEKDSENFDLVYIIIKDEYKNLFYDYVKVLNYKPMDINDLDLNNFEKFDNILDYLNSREINESN